MIVKYATIAFNLPFPFPRHSGVFDFDTSTELRQGSIADRFKLPDVKHWSDWLGSIAWEQLGNNELLLSSWMSSKNPDVLDAENEALRSKVSTIFRILPLVAALTPPFEEVYLLSGKGSLTAQGLVIEDIRSVSRVTCWTRPYYNEQHWDEFHVWATSEFNSTYLLNHWKALYIHYDRFFIQGKSNRQLFEAYRSFDESMRGTQLEFKIPNLVRALECIVVCWGYKDFARKVLTLSGLPNTTLPYQISVNSNQLLRDLYQLRNDCSHGKPFAYSLEKKLGRFPEGSLVAKYEFLAEWAARTVITQSFTNHSIIQHTSDRDSLVEAWAKDLITR